MATRAAQNLEFFDAEQVGGVNGSDNDHMPWLSPDGLSIYFTSGRAAGHGSTNLWIARRQSAQAAFDAPVELLDVNSSSKDESPALTGDELTLFFASERSGGPGNLDIWMATRTDAASPFVDEEPTFIVLRDCSGEVQCVAATELVRDLHLKVEDTIELRGRVRAEERAHAGYEVDVHRARVLNPAASDLPFNSAADLSAVGAETRLSYRPLSVRNDAVGDVFRIAGALLTYYREYLRSERFTEIITSKIVASGTEGGTNLFEVRYFEKTAYLAQSPQFYKEHGVAGFERVFETGHVYRAEPHATSRHLTEYYSLDLEVGFIDGPQDVIQIERELLTDMFERLNREHGATLARHGAEPLPSMLEVPTWEFDQCLELLEQHFRRSDLTDDLDPEAERQLCALAEKETGVPAVFVIGFPLASRPFYTAPRGTTGAAHSFDLLFRGIEITTGGQRLHARADLEAALRRRGIDPQGFESHLRMFELGMPPHGGLAIGLERLTAQVLGLQNVREAVLYPRDRYRVTP